MRGRGWTTTRLLVDTATLGVGLGGLLACRRAGGAEAADVGILTLVLALILTAATDRVWAGARRRPFWFGFAATGWTIAALAITHRAEIRPLPQKWVPAIARAYRQYAIQKTRAIELSIPADVIRAGLRPGPMPIVKEPSTVILWIEMVAEMGLVLLVGGLVAVAGGLGVAGVAWVLKAVARRVRDRRDEPPATGLSS